MSAPVDTKAGAKSKRLLRAAKPPSESTTKLCADQVRLLRLFGAMGQAQQGHLLIIAEGLAENFPRTVKPTLRLVAGGER